jgi:hypothetical protein
MYILWMDIHCVSIAIYGYTTYIPCILVRTAYTWLYVAYTRHVLKIGVPDVGVIATVTVTMGTQRPGFQDWGPSSNPATGTRSGRLGQRHP